MSDADPVGLGTDLAGLTVSDTAETSKKKRHNQQYLDQLKDLSPKSKEALEVFELGVNKEASGAMSAAIEYYRRAVKLDSKVETLYRAKIYSEIPEPEERKDHGHLETVRPLDEKMVARIKVGPLLTSFREESIHALDDSVVSPLKNLPDDIIQLIIEILIHTDTPSFVKFALSCKKIAYLGFATSDGWRTLCRLVYPYQNYNREVAQLNGISSDQDVMVASYDHNWHRMYKERPFIKFHGIYISVVNYYREGGRSEGSSSWNNPIRMITYYRYIRFYKDGTCLKLLTVVEPHQIVGKFTKDWHQNGLDKIYRGTWHTTPDGQVCIDSEGSVDRYRFIENLQITDSNHRHRHNKLTWINYEFMDIATTERNNFDIKKEKPYIFSRVNSYRYE